MHVDHLTHFGAAIGDRPAVIDDRPGETPRTLNYADFNALANSLANGLAELGIAPGQHVAWWGKNSLETMCAIHATRKAGAVSVPIPYRSTADEALYLLDNAEVVAAIVEGDYAQLVADLATELPLLRDVIVYDGHPESGQLAWDEVLGAQSTPAAEGSVEITRMMIYTSGTTGQPKGAVRQVGGAPNQFNALLESFGWPTMDDLRFLTTGPCTTRVHQGSRSEHRP